MNAWANLHSILGQPNTLFSLQGIDVVTSHGYYLSAGDGVDSDLAITWEMLYGRELAPGAKVIQTRLTIICMENR
jgi:hypothetical protein